MASREILRRTDSQIEHGADTEQSKSAEQQVADLQRVVAMLLEKNEQLRRQLSVWSESRHL